MNKNTARRLALKLAVVLPLTASAAMLSPAAWAAPSVHAPAAVRPLTVNVPATSWVPWDGNHITSLANCQSRRNYLIATYKIRTSAMKCQQFTIFTCPASYYWMVMYDQDSQPAKEFWTAPSVSSC